MAYIGSIPAYQASGVRPRDEFTGDGTQICFALSQSVPGSFESGVTVVLDNVQQQPVEAFTVVDTKTLTFSAVTGTFTKNETVTGGTSSATGTVLKVNLGSIVIRPLTGTFTNTETVTGGSSSASATNSAVSTNTGSGILFSEIPASGAVLYVVHEGNATYNLVPAAASVSATQLADNLRNFTVDTFTGDGTTTAFTLTDTPSSANAILVMVDGIVQTRTTNYTLSSNIVTFTGAPDNGSSVTIIHLGFTTISRTGLVDGSVTPVKLSSGAPTWDGTYLLKVGSQTALGGATNPVLAITGSANNYIQGYIYNKSNGTGASADLVAYPDNGTDASGWIDMGITSSTFSSVPYGITGANEGYLFMSAPSGASKTGNLVIATDSTGTQNAIKFATGGFGSTTERVRIDATGNVGIGQASPASKLDVNGNIKVNNQVYSAGDLILDAVFSTMIKKSGSTNATINQFGIGLAGSNLTSGTGIAFPPTQSASSDPNTLDDYEEGTWTPNLGGTATYVYNAGWYTKIGRVVVADFEVNVSSIGTGSTLSILGLPFTCGSTGNGQGGGIGYFSGAANSIYYLTARIDQGSTSISIATMLGPGAIMNTSVAFFTNSTRILGTITYMTAS